MTLYEDVQKGPTVLYEDVSLRIWLMEKPDGKQFARVRISKPIHKPEDGKLQTGGLDSKPYSEFALPMDLYYGQLRKAQGQQQLSGESIPKLEE